MFKIGSRYRHKNCIDVDIQVLDIHIDTPDLKILKILWLNRNWLNGNFIIDSDIIKIKKEQFNNWSKV
jgi:hypothetical protein